LPGQYIPVADRTLVDPDHAGVPAALYIFLQSQKSEVVMPLKTLREYLDSHNVRYVVVMHSPAYTAQETAQAASIPGHIFAKTTIVTLDGKLAMAVLPSDQRVDLQLLGAACDAKKVALAPEFEFQDQFPGCEIGAMSPFGNLYKMDVYVEEGLARENRMAFNAGSHTALIQMSVRDFLELVKPKVVRLSSVYAN
jgi:Ala-tRNA(Pro) deacylase